MTPPSNEIVIFRIITPAALRAAGKRISLADSTRFSQPLTGSDVRLVESTERVLFLTLVGQEP